jgi:hypothetical protein
MTVLPAIASVLVGVVTGLFLFRRLAISLIEDLGAFKQSVRELRGRDPRRQRPRRPMAPSLSRGLLRLAERRLPRGMGAAERERWTQEMRADVASLPRRKRLRAAFNIWRKGAPGMPVGTEGTPRSARD